MKFALPKIERETAALFVVTFFIGQSISLLAPILPEIKNEFQLSYTIAALVLSSFGVARLILALPTGYLYERVNRKKLLMAGIALLSLGSLAAASSKDFITFLLSQVVMGAGFSICITIVLVSLSTSSTKETRGKTLGMNAFARSLGNIIAPTIAGLIAVAFSWRSVFLYYAGISALCLVLLYFLFSGESKKAAAEMEAGDDARNYKKTLYSLFIVIFLVHFVSAAFRNNAVPLYAADILKLDAGSIGFMLSLSALVFLVFAPVSAHLSDIHGRKVFMVLSTLALALSVFGFLAATNYAHLLIVMAIFGYGLITYTATTAMLGDITHHRHASRNFSRMRFVSDFGLVAGPIAAGLMLDTYGFAATGWVLGILAFTAFLIVLYFIEEPAFRSRLKMLLGIATFGRYGE